MHTGLLSAILIDAGGTRQGLLLHQALGPQLVSRGPTGCREGAPAMSTGRTQCLRPFAAKPPSSITVMHPLGMSMQKAPLLCLHRTRKAGSCHSGVRARSAGRATAIGPACPGWRCLWERVLWGGGPHAGACAQGQAGGEAPVQGGPEGQAGGREEAQAGDGPLEAGAIVHVGLDALRAVVVLQLGTSCEGQAAPSSMWVPGLRAWAFPAPGVQLQLG